MASYAEIANLAAAEIGTGARITDPDDDTVLARAVGAVWDVERKATLRDGSWNFATRRAELAELSEAVGYPFTHVYELPSDCLRLIEVLNCSARDDYQLEGQRILCDTAGPLYIRYVADIATEALFDAAFTAAFARRIAMATGTKIAGSTFDVAAAERKYLETLQAAKRVDAAENPGIAEEPSEWEYARLGSMAWYDPLRLG